MARRYDYYYYTPSRPREAKGGIKSQSKRAGFGRSWWARRWIEVLEGFNIGARLHRGRSYARQGQVLSIHIEKGKVSAKVQGTRARPYKIDIKVKTLSNADWERVAEALNTQALFAAKLCAGEMPEDIEEVFAKTRLSLFPSKINDLETECSCPDWSNPCKHIAAVYYLLGEEFDRDPFLIFKMRGLEREELLSLISGPEGRKGKPSREEAFRHGVEPREEPKSAPVPLPHEPESFWGREQDPDGPFGQVCIPQMTAALPKRLGNFPFWQGKEGFMEVLEGIYKKASIAGMDVFLCSLGHEVEEDPG
jgi:uncharacterized Zn finger protein